MNINEMMLKAGFEGFEYAEKNFEKFFYLVLEHTLKDDINLQTAYLDGFIAGPVMKECRHCGYLCKPNDSQSKKWYPLQQEREWFDLTCEEVTALIREGAADGGWQGFATQVQTAFKEKNK